jgi:hypothetical protein
MMIGTHFSLSDGVAGMEHVERQYTAADVSPPVNLKDTMVATHFDLTNPMASGWETTHRASYQRQDAEPASAPHIELQRGYGARAKFNNLGAFAPFVPLYDDSSRDPGRWCLRAHSEGDDHITFQPGISNRWHRTNHELGDGQCPYSTTSGSAYTPRRGETLDP